MSNTTERQLELIDPDDFDRPSDDEVTLATVTTPTRWRRWRGRLAIGALSVGLVGVGVYAYMTYQTGVEWEDRAVDLSGQLTSTESQLGDTRSNLRETRSDLKSTTAKLEDKTGKLVTARQSLATARDDIGELEGQVRTLANEKAQVEDEREQAQASADYLAGVASGAAIVGADLDTCVVDLADWIGSQPSFLADMWEWDEWSADGTAIATDCAEARTAFWDFVGTLPE